MTEINTFSALVDDTVTRTGRPSNRNDIISFARQTMRECQSLIKPSNDIIEDTLTADGDGYVWDIPQYFREMLVVRYPTVLDTYSLPIYPKFIQPSRFQRNVEHYYYRTGESYAFKGVDSGLAIDIAYLTWFPKLAYYQDVATRPATFSLEDQVWSYLSATTDAEKLAAREAVSNWMLRDWYDLLLEGSCAKMWKAVADQRASSSFGLYKSLQNDYKIAVTPESYSGNSQAGQ